MRSVVEGSVNGMFDTRVDVFERCDEHKEAVSQAAIEVLQSITKLTQ